MHFVVILHMAYISLHYVNAIYSEILLKWRFLHMFSYLCTFTCKKAPFWFLNFLINKKVLRMYEAYFLFNLTKNIIVIFSILGLLSHFTNIIWFSHIFPKKGKPNFWKFFHIYGKLVYLTFFLLFLAANQNKFHSKLHK